MDGHEICHFNHVVIPKAIAIASFQERIFLKKEGNYANMR